MEERTEPPLILVVDDNSTNVLLARAVLESQGYLVAVAGSGTEMERRLQEGLPDLILMDILLPDADGLELTRRLKQDPPTSGLPVIALSAYAMPADEERARAAGCDDYLSKPFPPRELVERVAALLTRGPRGHESSPGEGRHG